MLRKSKECWYKNLTKKDINLSDLNLKLPAGKTVNLYKQNPTLKPYLIKESEEEGLLFVCLQQKKIIKLPCAPKLDDPYLPKIIQESTRCLPSRVKTALTTLKEDDLIEELKTQSIDDMVFSSEDIEEGFSDPLVQAGNLTGDTGTVVDPNSTYIPEKITPNKTNIGSKPSIVDTGESRYIAVRTM